DGAAGEGEAGGGQGGLTDQIGTHDGVLLCIGGARTTLNGGGACDVRGKFEGFCPVTRDEGVGVGKGVTGAGGGSFRLPIGRLWCSAVRGV
ncbi:hypothetical protein, partial [Micromonospora arida]|uniref:hypothetical protein n=1 Tax=Micromonospora arida TaxID=2203715 RepID=UPI0033FFC074